MSAYHGEPYPGFFKDPWAVKADEFFAKWKNETKPEDDIMSNGDFIVSHNDNGDFSIMSLDDVHTTFSIADDSIINMTGAINIIEPAVACPVRPAVGDKFHHTPTNEHYVWDGACWVNVSLMKQCDIPAESTGALRGTSATQASTTEEDRAAKAYERAIKVVR